VTASEKPRYWLAPAGCALAITAVLGSEFLRLPWPFVDLYNSFYKATTMTWPETFGHAFGAGVEYRPLMIIGVKLSHQLVGLRAWCYELLVLLQFAAILLGLVWIWAPTTRSRATAACVALACVAGLHTSRVLFMFMPLNVHSLGVVILLAAILLALSPQSRLTQSFFLPLTLVALFLLESGVLVVAVTLVLWKMQAPNAGGRAVVGVLAASAIYVAVRLGFGMQEAPAAYAETGLGFGDVETARLRDIFEHAPWMLWAYNIVASFFTVIASEPRAGRYLFVEALLSGRVPTWMYIHVVTSLITTGIVGYALATSRVQGKDRLVAAAGMTLLVAGTALGFLYTRDRIALSAGVGYAMLLYVAVAAVLERHAAARPLGLTAAFVQVCIAVVFVGWSIRTAETYLQLRDAGWEHYREWTERYEELGGLARSQTDLLMRLREDVLSQAPRDPRRDPPSTYMLFQRRFDRLDTAVDRVRGE
jgi:hypothetical protein